LESLGQDVAPDPCGEVKYVLDRTLPYDNLLMTKGEKDQSFIWGNSLISGSGENGFFYLQDYLGSPIRLLGEDSADVTMAYDEFGVPEVMAGNIQGFDNPFGFTGYQVDEVSGLQYAQARYYAPMLGRFGAEDPLKDQLNWYGYCGGNPVNFVDPSGLATEWEAIPPPPAPPPSPRPDSGRDNSETFIIPPPAPTNQNGGADPAPPATPRNCWCRIWEDLAITVLTPSVAPFWYVSNILVSTAELSSTVVGYGGSGTFAPIPLGLHLQSTVVADSQGNVGLAFFTGLGATFPQAGAGVTFIQVNVDTIFDLGIVIGQEENDLLGAISISTGGGYEFAGFDVAVGVILDAYWNRIGSEITIGISYGLPADFYFFPGITHVLPLFNVHEIRDMLNEHSPINLRCSECSS